MSLKNTFFNLSCAFDTSNFFKQDWICDGEERVLQYADGFKKFFNIYKNYSNYYNNIHIVDNTIKNISELDKRIKNEIPENANFVFTQKNNYGKFNKGAGILENWHEIEKLTSNYEFIFHFEPRLKLNSGKIFDTFIKERKTTFLSHTIEQFKTGFIVFKNVDFKKYLSQRKAEDLCHPYTSLEDDIYHFFKENKKDFTLIDKSDILWHDSAINSWVEY